jgi:hypothetical protein
MELYEIRILRGDQTPLTDFEQHYLNDEAAIRSAGFFAGELPFQVWRRSTCVYSRKIKPPASSAA